MPNLVPLLADSSSNLLAARSQMGFTLGFHIVLAAYMLTGFLLASIYAVAMLRGKRDRYQRLGVIIPLTVACIAAPFQFLVGDTAARAIAHDQPAKFAGMECVYHGGPDQTEYLG